MYGMWKLDRLLQDYLLQMTLLQEKLRSREKKKKDLSKAAQPVRGGASTGLDPILSIPNPIFLDYAGMSQQPPGYWLPCLHGLVVLEPWSWCTKTHSGCLIGSASTLEPAAFDGSQWLFLGGWGGGGPEAGKLCWTLAPGCWASGLAKVWEIQGSVTPNCTPDGSLVPNPMTWSSSRVCLASCRAWFHYHGTFS